MIDTGCDKCTSAHFNDKSQLTDEKIRATTISSVGNDPDWPSGDRTSMAGKPTKAARDRGMVITRLRPMSIVADATSGPRTRKWMRKAERLEK